MRRVFSLCLGIAACAPSLWSQAGCGSSPAAAVLRELGLSASTTAEGGFRVKDVIFDNALRRSFVRVEQCGHAERPLTLLPLGAMAKVEENTTGMPGTARDLAVRTRQDANGPTVQAGTAVAVTMLDARAQVLVRGRLLSSAAIGGSVEVEIASLSGDAPPRRVHGRLAAADTVEVLP